MTPILTYDTWTDTAYTLHMIAQMMGKVKLVRMPAQPEWGHIVLHFTPQGLTTGLIPNGERSFAINLNLDTSTVFTQTVSGDTAGFSLRNNTSVSEYYNDFKKMLATLVCDTVINEVPQEMGTRIPFYDDTQKHDYDSCAARDFFQMYVYARNTLLDFASPFRGKKILPSFFWGTFDVSTVLFSGKPSPFPGSGVIEVNGFDEQFIEAGFWAGDPSLADPSFFIMPYPFIRDDLGAQPVKPDKAVWSTVKMEYFLSLKDALSYPDPRAAIREFFEHSFHVVTKRESWACVDWFTQPLTIPVHENQGF
ncbi:DUF5996 family protein [Christensenella timonensis]|uniref:DUF5996 family protein n=1 Tax=Christensenella timonensis TaxID=1816678 RepID=UPI00083103F5|nr:DUF5996 family protein [Christensenella timonensis]